MSGYYGYSKSNNALDAESKDRFPLSIAAKVLAKKIGWTVQKAKAFLEKQGRCEWHHTSSRYNETDYYDVSDEYIDDFRDEVLSFIFVAEKKENKETKVFFKCWNWERDKNEPRKLEWSVTKRLGNYTNSLQSVKTTMLNVRATLEHEHVAGHKTRDRIFAENMRAITEILAAID